MKLKYLFTAYFADGSVFNQPEDDHSELDPEKRSAFYDVLASEKELVRFSLRGEGNQFTVDLKTGEFGVNGVKFFPVSDSILPIANPKFRLIFLRWHEAKTNMDVESGEVENTVDKIIAYDLGWECRIDGKNYKQIIRIT